MNRKTQKALIALFIIQTILTGLVLLNMFSINSKVNAIYRDSYSSAILEDASMPMRMGSNPDVIELPADKPYTICYSTDGKNFISDEVVNHLKGIVLKIRRQVK